MVLSERREREMALTFRSLRADEIEARIGQISKSGTGLSLLLYKDSRTDRDILDETVGPEGWQCSYDVVGGELFCTVSIWSDERQQWVSKQDVGTPSNMEAEKGRASDAFKRACFRWGIGVELYSAPRIWVGAKDCNLKESNLKGNNGKYQCYDRFSVEQIMIESRKIVGVVVRNDTTGRTVFSWGDTKRAAPTDGPATAEQLEELGGLVEALATSKNVSKDTVIDALMKSKAVVMSGASELIETGAQATAAIGQLRTWLQKG